MKFSIETNEKLDISLKKSINDKYFDDVEEILDGPDETEFVGE